MQVSKILRFLRDEIHTVVLATADGEGNPFTCAADVMDCDENGVYFLTARGKNLYARLQARPFVALTGIKGESTMTRAALSVRGKVREEPREVLSRLLEKNPYMYEIYPAQVSREALVAFCLYDGEGEWFDLSKKPIERRRFAVGGRAAVKNEEGRYLITGKCTGCGKCLDVCPQRCIDLSLTPAVILQAHCLRCGNCLSACPVGGVERA